MYRIPGKSGIVDGKRRSYGESIRNEELRLKLSASVKGQKSGKISRPSNYNKWIMNAQNTNIRRINNSGIVVYRGLCKGSVYSNSSRLNQDVFNHEVKTVDNQREPLKGDSSYACADRTSSVQNRKIYRSVATEREDVGVSQDSSSRSYACASKRSSNQYLDVNDVKESCFGYKINKNTSLNTDTEDEDSEDEDRGRWLDAHVSEYNGLKMKISRKRKRGEDIDESPFNAPLPKKINVATPLNTPLLNKKNGTSPLNTPISKNINITSPLNTPLPKNINAKVY